MSADGPNSEWGSDVVAFLTTHLPREDRDGESVFNHMFSSAYQMGCKAMAALGQVDETEWGAVFKLDPQLPDTLPRWDDICCVVLGLASQVGGLTYQMPDGSRSQRPLRAGKMTFVVRTPRPVPAPNVVSGRGSGFAHGQLDWIFFRGWRIADGWLSGREETRALEIFHDPLAIQMRREVISRSYPDLPELAQ